MSVKKNNKAFKRNKNSGLRFASLHILTHYFCPLNAALNFKSRPYQTMKIGIVSEQTGLGIHTIRYYEKQGLIKKPEKDESGHRAYKPRDIEVLDWVSCMKNSGMSLNKIKEYTKAFYADDCTTCATLLEEHLKHLLAQGKKTDHYIEVTKSKIIRFKSS
jgi:DNA-binding transcriptional MerR regulator|tara:strand:+ start:639 stop:1118 length:480 start_codon:yes stop_codon:yes gene_type:complete